MAPGGAAAAGRLTRSRLLVPGLDREPADDPPVGDLEYLAARSYVLTRMGRLEEAGAAADADLGRPPVAGLVAPERELRRVLEELRALEPASA